LRQLSNTNYYPKLPSAHSNFSEKLVIHITRMFGPHARMAFSIPTLSEHHSIVTQSAPQPDV